MGRYTLLTKLGGGGMADVHLAVRDRGTEVKDLLALKVPKEEVAENLLHLQVGFLKRELGVG